MSKTPTAEEVLGLYLDMVSAGDLFKRTTTRQSERFHKWTEATSKFKDSLEQWQAAQGPVTLEWFLERFGTTTVECKEGQIVFWVSSGAVDIAVLDTDDELFHVQLHNPTRSKIEALVEMLGGTQ